MNVADHTRWEAAGVNELPISDPHYPPLLRLIRRPPPLLYVRGDPAHLLRPQVAIVGARRASASALRLATELASQLVAAGLGVCSGLALGIDGAAHRGALQGGGTTVAVMATGIDRVYPHRHRGLAGEITAAGCLVTEFPPGTKPRREFFPQRNRIVSGLSLGALVVEAALPSGSLITAGTATEQGREVFTLPWSIAHPGGAGCLQLLRDGAKMVRTVQDILEELGPLFQLHRELLQSRQLVSSGASIPADPVLALVGYEVISVDELLAASTLPPGDTLASLSRLELEGEITRCAGGYMRC